MEQGCPFCGNKKVEENSGRKYCPECETLYKVEYEVNETYEEY